MPTDPTDRAPAEWPGMDETAVFSTQARGSEAGGYVARYEEDSFDYPSPSSSWSDGEQPPDLAPGPAPSTGAGSADEARRTEGGHARETDGWQQVAGLRRPALLAAAAMVIMGGFGLALSMVNDTVSSTPDPGASSGTAQVSAPKSPPAPVLPPPATASAPPPAGGGAGDVTFSPTQSSPLPGTGDQRDDQREQEQQQDREREDGDGADDN
ncbi:hypothetical protein ACRJ4B_10600 [Streptomyces sp. GTA36]